MRNHGVGPAIALTAGLLVACALPPPATDPPSVDPAPPVDSTRLAEMHKKYVGGRNFYNKGEFEHAIRTLEAVWIWDPDYGQVTPYLTRSLLLSGLEYYAEQRYRVAIERWEKARVVDPGNAKAGRYIARAREELRKIGRAEDG